MNFDYLAREIAQQVLVAGLNKVDRDYRPIVCTIGDKVGLKRPGVSVTAVLDGFAQVNVDVPDSALMLNDGQIMEKFFAEPLKDLFLKLTEGSTGTSVLMVRPYVLPPDGVGVRSEWGETKDFGLGVVVGYDLRGFHRFRVGVLFGYAETRKGD